MAKQYTGSVFRIKSNATRKWTIATHVHLYFLSLLVSEIIQAIGTLDRHIHSTRLEWPLTSNFSVVV